MSTIADRAAEKLRADLEPGEQLLAATKAHVDGGSVNVGIMVATTGLVNRLEGPAELAYGAVLVATDRRLIVMSATAGTFQPNRLVLSIPLGELAEVRTGTKRVMLVKLPTITLVHREGAEATFEVPKVNARDADNVVQAIRRGGAADASD